MNTSSEPGAPAGEGIIPLFVPEIRGNEWRYIKECLDTNWVSSAGPFVNRFEQELARRVGRKHGVATVNGTSAIHIALLVAGVQPDDEVLVSTLTFIAPVNAIRYIGAWPVLVDAEPSYWQMDVHLVEDFLKKDCAWSSGALRNRTTGRRVRAILPVDILGHPVEMDSLMDLAEKYDLQVIEDATESLGALYRGEPVGSKAHIACFSFNGNKIITTGGGGMIATDDATWAEKARYLTTQAKDDPVEFVHREVGYNYRLTNLQAAMGCAQLEKLDEYVQIKRDLAARYSQAIADLPGLTQMPEAPWAQSTFWMYTLLVDPDSYGMDSRALLRHLKERKIQTRPLWQPIHRSPAHQHCQIIGGEVAEALNSQALSLPCSVGLPEASFQRVIEALRECAQPS